MIYVLGYLGIGVVWGMWMLHSYWNPKDDGVYMGYKPIVRTEGMEVAQGRAMTTFIVSLLFWLPVLIVTVFVLWPYAKMNPHFSHRLRWKKTLEEHAQMNEIEAMAGLPLSALPESWCECQREMELDT